MKIPKEIKKRSGLNNTKDKFCSVFECNKNAIRNVSEYEYKGFMKLANIKYKRIKNKRIYLCKEHFSDVNKENRKNNKNKKGFLENAQKPYKNKSW